MEGHERKQEGPLFFPTPTLAVPMARAAARLFETHAMFGAAFHGLRCAGDALCWRTKDVLG